MKGNIKKLAVFVIVAVLAMFIVVAAASAWWPARNALWGQYAVTGGGACVSCPPGTIDITKDVFLLGGCTNYSPDVVEGVYTFYTNNTGTFKGTLRILMFDAAGVPLFGASMDTEWTFKYSVTDDGKISFTDTVQTTTFTSGPLKGVAMINQGGPLHGRISSDRYYLTVTCGPAPMEDWPQGALPVVTGPDGSQLMCIINLAGQRR